MFVSFQIALNQYKTCNLGTRPAYAIVTGKSTSSDRIMHIQSMLEGADFSKLKTAGIVSDKAESLAKYSNTSVKEYVGSYGNYYNGLYGTTKGMLVNKTRLQLSSARIVYFN